MEMLMSFFIGFAVGIMIILCVEANQLLKCKGGNEMTTVYLFLISFVIGVTIGFLVGYYDKDKLKGGK